MSKNYNDCDVVFDLLPLYLDEKTGAESNVFVKEHLAQCKECREVCRLMSAEVVVGVSDSTDASNITTQATGKYNRRRKRHPRAWKKWAIIVTGLLGYICLMLGIVLYVNWLLTNGIW